MLNMKKVKIFLISILFLGFSCKENIKNKDKVIEINMAINYNSKPFCDLVQDNVFIKLETPDNSPIGIIKEVKISDNKIFVHDIITESILIFTYPEGKFISTIQSKGNGPGEYLSIFSFEVIVKEKCIEILDGNLKKLFKYKFDGEFIDYRNIPFHARLFSYLNDNELVFTKHLFFENKDFGYQIITMDNEMIVKNKYLKIDRMTSVGIAQGNQISKIGDGILFLPINSTYAYKVNHENITLTYYFNFKEHWDEDLYYGGGSNPSDLIEILNKKQIISGLGVTEGDDFLLINFWYIKEHYVVLYNKNTNQLNYMDKDDGGLEYRMFNKGVYDNYFISIKAPNNLLEILKNNKGCFEEKDIKMIEGLNENDNPVLMLTRFKE